MAFPELTPPELAKLDGCIREVCDSMARIQGEKDFQGEVADRVKEEFKIPPTDFKKLVAERREGKSINTVHKHEEVVGFNEKVIEAVRKQKK